MPLMRIMQQTMPDAVEKNLHTEIKWSRLFYRVHDVWRVHRQMPFSRRCQAHSLRKDFDRI